MADPAGHLLDAAAELARVVAARGLGKRDEGRPRSAVCLVEERRAADARIGRTKAMLAISHRGMWLQV